MLDGRQGSRRTSSIADVGAAKLSSVCSSGKSATGITSHLAVHRPRSSRSPQLASLPASPFPIHPRTPSTLRLHLPSSPVKTNVQNPARPKVTNVSRKYTYTHPHCQGSSFGRLDTRTIPSACGWSESDRGPFSARGSPSVPPAPPSLHPGPSTPAATCCRRHHRKSQRPWGDTESSQLLKCSPDLRRRRRGLDPR